MSLLRHGWIALLVIQASLIAFGAWRHSPTADEPAHLVSGWYIWKTGRNDAYRVNPPLVRVIASLPLLLTESTIRLDAYRDSPAARFEFGFGNAWLEDYGGQALWLMTQARWMCLPFALLGTCVCCRWATELYGARAGLLSTSLWCFSPTVLAHGQLITADVAAASTGATAAYLFWRWLKNPTWTSALCAGLAFGLAQLTKFTLIVFVPLWPLIWVRYRRRRRQAWRMEGLQLGLLMLISLYVVHAGYGFEGMFTRLGDFEFVSRKLGGAAGVGGGRTANRFATTWVGKIPVPLPKNYLMGIDLQRHDFEGRSPSYMHGRWRAGGWWYFYLYALAVKEPLGVWGLAAVALFGRRTCMVARRDELLLILPLAVVFVLVSSQTGFSHHPRYMLPIYPFAFIWIGRVAARQSLTGTDVEEPTSHRNWVRPLIVVGLLNWAVASSLSVYPHSFSYFNELAGGPLGGPKRLLASGTDWGQNLIYLREWLDRHPDADNVRLAWAVPLINPRLIFPDIPRPPTEDEWRNLEEPLWYVLSVNELYAEHGKYAYFRNLKPTAIVAYSMYVYRLE